MTKLNDLAWVPCDDAALRQSNDVLPSQDLGREDAPVAKLSPGLLHLLEQEGVESGAAIPDSPALRKLEVAGVQFDAEELAQLLPECCEQRPASLHNGLANAYTADRQQPACTAWPDRATGHPEARHARELAGPVETHQRSVAFVASPGEWQQSPKLAEMSPNRIAIAE